MVIIKFVIEILFALFLVIYVAYILEVNQWKFLSILVVSFVFFSILISIILFMKSYLNLDNWTDIGLFCTGLSIIIYPSIFFTLMSREEKHLIYQKFFRKKKYV